MEFKLVIAGKHYGTKTLPGMNDYRATVTRSQVMGNRMMRQAERLIMRCFAEQLPYVMMDREVIVHFYFYEPDKRRDLDNILSFAQKAVLDAAQKFGFLPNDNSRFINHITADRYFDKDNPRIEVVFEELEEGKRASKGVRNG